MLKEKLIEFWKSSQSVKEFPKKLIDLALFSEAKKFLISCIDEDGAIHESDGELLPLDKGYMLIGVKGIRLNEILNVFKNYLIKTQNKDDGGWGDHYSDESDIIATINAILILKNLDEQNEIINKSVEKGLSYINKEMEQILSLHRRFNKEFGNILYSVLLRTINKDSIIPSKVQVVKRWMSKNISELDPILLRLLIDSNIIKESDLKSLYRKISTIVDRNRKKNINIRTLTTQLALLITISSKKNMVDVKNMVDYIITLRNSDGGWPIALDDHSSFTTTVCVLYALTMYTKFTK
jgi:prenyltransferase beta subunit